MSEMEKRFQGQTRGPRWMLVLSSCDELVLDQFPAPADRRQGPVFRMSGDRQLPTL